MIPPATLYAGIVALSIGLFGLGAAIWRTERLWKGVRELQGTRPQWDAIAALNVTPAFSAAMRRLKSIRDAVSSEPEEAWRATFDLVISGERWWETLVHSLSSLAVLVGLMGTVMGFLGLEIQLGPHEQPKLAAQLPKLFSATFCGIIGAALILGLGLQILRTAIDSWANAVEDIGRLVLLPALPRPPIRIPSRIQEIIITELTNRLDTVAKAWHDSLAGPANSLQNLVSSANSSIQEIHRALEDVKISAQDLSDFATSARQIKAASASMAKSATAHASAGAQFSSVAINFEKSLGGLSDAVKESTARLRLLDESVGVAGNEMRAQGQTVTKAVEEMATEFKGLSNVVTDRMQQEVQVARDARDAVAAVHQQLSALKSVQEALGANADKMSLAAGALKSAADDSLRELPISVSAELAGALKRIEHQHQLLLDEAKDQLTRSAAGSSEAATKLGSASGQIAEAADTIAASINGSVASLNITQRQILETAGGLTTAASTFTRAAQHTLEDIPNHLDKGLRSAISHWQAEHDARLASLATQLFEEVRACKECLYALRAARQESFTGNGQPDFHRLTDESSRSAAASNPPQRDAASDNSPIPETGARSANPEMVDLPPAIEELKTEGQGTQEGTSSEQSGGELSDLETSSSNEPLSTHPEVLQERDHKNHTALHQTATPPNPRHDPPTPALKKWWQLWK